MKIEFQGKPLETLFLHGAKQPWSQCVGILLGSVAGDKIIVSRAIPLFHTAVFTPQLDIALKLVATLFPELEIVGVYVCPDKDTASTLQPIGRKLGQSLNVKFACVLKPVELANTNVLPLQFWTGPKFADIETDIEVLPSLKQANDSLTSHLKAKTYAKLYDFDDFLDDPSVDFTNEFIY